MVNEAIANNKRWGELTVNKVKTDVALAYIYAAAGRKVEARKIIEDIEAGDLGGNDYRGMALAYTALGENDMALDWLEKSYQMHEESLCSLKIDFKFDPLRSDPRFNNMVKKVGL